jgi:hypothetical protein
MSKVLHATCYKVVFPGEFKDFDGERDAPKVLHATNWVTSVQSCSATLGGAGSTLLRRKHFGGQTKVWGRDAACPMCYVLHATKWFFLGNSRILTAKGDCSMCYMLQIGLHRCKVAWLHQGGGDEIVTGLFKS